MSPRSPSFVVGLLAALLAVAVGSFGCSPAGDAADPSSPGTTSRLRTPGAGGSPSNSPSSSASPRETPSQSPSPSATKRTSTPTPSAQRSKDPRNHFYVKDKTAYASPWFVGRHRIMIDFGCVDAPYYSPDSRCDGGAGFHHGMDLALPCGTDVVAARSGVVVAPDAPGSLGDAYGSLGFRLRVKTSKGNERDIVIGHAAKVFVDPGDRVKKGQRIARSGDRGAPDGCHLHFEVRNADGGLATAREPRPLLDLRP